MHKNIKLLPQARRELYRRWIDGDSIAELARHYRVDRQTIMTECFGKSGRTFASREHRRKFLYAFVNWYNTTRPHESLGGVPPLKRLEDYLARIKNVQK